jgi:hypothetical protein
VIEQRFIEISEASGKQIVRPFQSSAQVHCRGYSLPLQRVITDLGADVPFGQIPQKLLEHHGLTVPISSAQAITQSHAQRILANQPVDTDLPIGAAVASLVTQIDGSMLPMVETTPEASEVEQLDRRKTRKLSWKEARLGFSRAATAGSQPIFAATLGSVDQAGQQLLHTAIQAGLGANTFVHGVGDGAPWIASQMERHFGEPGRFLLDFYHLCDYLAAASHICDPKAPDDWLNQQKKRLKLNHFDAVLKALQPFLEADSLPDQQAPVRVAYRYLDNRPHQLDYKGAIADGLPIGSGEIESAHRYIIQSRLKRPGSWWTLAKAEAMLALRVLRANQGWSAYWQALSADNA